MGGRRQRAAVLPLDIGFGESRKETAEGAAKGPRIGFVAETGTAVTITALSMIFNFPSSLFWFPFVGPLCFLFVRLLLCSQPPLCRYLPIFVLLRPCSSFICSPWACMQPLRSLCVIYILFRVSIIFFNVRRVSFLCSSGLVWLVLCFRRKHNVLVPATFVFHLICRLICG